MELANLCFSKLSGLARFDSFDCGLDDITLFLRNDALDYQIQKIANTYIFTDDTGNIMAFFSISNDCLNDMGEKRGFTNSIWNRLHRSIKLPNNKRIKQYPSVKIGRLGVHKILQGSGISYQMMDFIKGWVIEDHKPACRLLTLDAINENKQLKYYDRNNFRFLLSSDEAAKTRIMYYDLLKLS